ncbi:unnamed protein product [Rhizophagus irregularis]|nr:unnamed protein product [Rhizophagus irregularis]
MIDQQEIVQEIKLYREIDSHENIINFCGITNKENHNDQAKEYLLVWKMFDGRSLRSYLKRTLKNLTWEDKYKLAYQLTYTISFLHDKGIIHGDLNSVRSFIFNEKSDVYSIGVLLWEISSGKSPFEECWNGESDNRTSKEEYVIRRYILNYFNNQEIKLQEIYNWLLNNNNNNQNDSNSIYLLGYFNYHGIITCTNKHKAYELYQKAVELENVVAQLVLASIYIEGKGIKKNYNKAFELSKKLAKVGNPNGINRLGYCYSMGIGTEINMKKAFNYIKKQQI